jgi:hypothetical protein
MPLENGEMVKEITPKGYVKDLLCLSVKANII